ncbi:hypothetical protein [Halorubrum sp. CBA1125]|jgi:hypothetical protein|uniref:hypothetical protein n=1 Tax=Halorubrum sp. CBA1125 TaxID=2668072 RepID=UPI0018D202E1|nr:hypothetical protein [Halorubrum sp. CBA1125]
MSEDDGASEALRRVRESFENAADEAEEMSENAKREVRDAIDDLERRIDTLRDRD